MKNILLILSFSLFFFIQEKESMLVGTWECYHKEFESGKTTATDIDGNTFKISCDGVKFQLMKDFTGKEFTNNLKFTYKIKDSNIQLGNRSYIIEVLNDKELVLLESKRVFPMRQKFKKVSSSKN